MLFNSLEFLIFFPVVTLIYYFLPHHVRWIHLLLSSCIFYMFFIPLYILILLLTILVDYYAGIWIERSDDKRKKKYLVLSIISTCLILFIFKYTDFFYSNVQSLSHLLGFNYPQKTMHIILPIGLSFHTFQSLSYVIEVYKGRQRAERHFGFYALYVMFYPQLVSGPIERPQNLLLQLKQVKSFELSNLIRGMRLILFGLFVKMAVADNLGYYIDQIYDNPDRYNSESVITGLLFYSFQIYGDFFGYSTIALGCALCMGFTLMDNFKNPYFSKSFTEFWQRWHISLSTWFRDYVYIPLGGNKVSWKFWLLNILIVFALSGFWHGASWTFVIWGLLHGIVYISEKAISKFKNKIVILSLRWQRIQDPFRVILTFILVSILWILFRARNTDQVSAIIHALLSPTQNGDNIFIESKVWILLFAFVLFDFLLLKNRFDRWCSGIHPVVRWSVYAVLIFSILALSSVNQFPFIYFQF